MKSEDIQCRTVSSGARRVFDVEVSPQNPTAKATNLIAGKGKEGRAVGSDRRVVALGTDTVLPHCHATITSAYVVHLQHSARAWLFKTESCRIRMEVVAAKTRIGAFRARFGTGASPLRVTRVIPDLLCRPPCAKGPPALGNPMHRGPVIGGAGERASKRARPTALRLHLF